MLFLISPLQKSIAQVSWWHEIMQHYNACLPSVSLKDMHRKIRPNGRHILWHCKGHTGGTWNLVSPYGNNSYPTVPIDKWRETFLHMRISYLRNKTREIPNLSDDHCAHPVTDTRNGKDRRMDFFIHDSFDGCFNLINLNR